jgi:single-strand DNA-binding protein
MSFNQATIVGNLGNDPKVSRTQSGKPIVTFSVATSEKWKEETKTTWHNIVIFSEGLCRIAESYLKKGSKVLVQGKIDNDKYEKDGQTIYRSTIVLGGFNSTLTMLDGKDNRDNSGGNYGGASQGEYVGDNGLRQGGQQANFDDDIPFGMEWR